MHSNNGRQTSRGNVEFGSLTFDANQEQRAVERMKRTSSYNSLLSDEYCALRKPREGSPSFSKYKKSAEKIESYKKKNRNSLSRERVNSNSITQKPSISPIRTIYASNSLTRPNRISQKFRSLSNSSYEKERKMYESNPASHPHSQNRLSSPVLPVEKAPIPVQIHQRPSTQHNFSERGNISNMTL
jgi:hypothetical protein